MEFIDDFQYSEKELASNKSVEELMAERQAAVNFTIANQELEGIVISDRVKKILQDYANGKINFKTLYKMISEK